jgi:integrase
MTPNDLEVWFACARKAGADLPEELCSALRERIIRQDALHTKRPVLGVLKELAATEWRRYLRRSPWMFDHVIEVFNALIKQEVYEPNLSEIYHTEESVDRAMDEISLIARRYLLACSAPDYAVAMSSLDCILVDIHSMPGEVTYDHQGTTTVLLFQERLKRLLAGEYIFEKGRKRIGQTDESDDEQEGLTYQEDLDDRRMRWARNPVFYREDREAPCNPTGYTHYVIEAAATRRLAIHSFLEPLALVVMKEILILDNLHLIGDEWEIFAFCFLLSIEHGIPAGDIPNLGLEEECSHLGWIEEIDRGAILHLKIGSPYYPGGHRVYEEGQINLPLSKEAAFCFHELKRRSERSGGAVWKKGGPKTVAHLVKDAYGHFKEVWHRYTRKRGYRTDSLAFHHIWERTAVVDLQIPHPVIGLLRGKPSKGAQAESSYISMNGDDLVAASARIITRLRQRVGLPSPEITAYSAANGKEELGTPIGSLKDYWQKTLECIHGAETHNSVMACVIRFLRGLGVRQSTKHYNPVHYFSPLPLPCLEIQDKTVGGKDRPRYLPINNPIGEMILEVGKLIPRSRYLLYRDKQRFVEFERLGADRGALRDILFEPGARQPGRTAFFNELIRRGCGEAVRNTLMAHGTAIFQPYSEHGLLSLRQWLGISMTVLEPIYEEVGINKAARLLTEKIRNLARCPELQTWRPQSEGNGIPHHGLTNFEDASGYTYTPSPLIGSELQSLWRGRGAMAVGAIGWDLPDPHGLFLSLALELGIPAGNLRKFQKYYSFGSFVQMPATGGIYFVALMEHEDVGGLSCYPVYVGQSESASQNLCLAALRKMWVRLEKVSPGTTAGTLLGHRLFDAPSWANFPPASDDAIGRAFERIGIDPRHRRHIKPGSAYRFVERASDIIASWNHPGIVAGALRGYSKRGLNNRNLFDIFRVIAAQGETEIPSQVNLHPFLCPDLNWVLPYRQFAGKDMKRQLPADIETAVVRVIQSFNFRTGSMESDAVNDNRGRLKTAEEIKALAEGLEKAGIAPNYQMLRRLVNEAIPERTRGRVAASIVERVFASMVENGAAMVSSPIPLLAGSEYTTLLNRAISLVGKYRPRQSDSSHAREFLRLLLWILWGTGARQQEPLKRRRGEAIIVGSRLNLFITEGKTDNSRRVVEQQMAIDGQMNLQQEMVSRIQKTDLKNALFQSPLNRANLTNILTAILSGAAGCRFTAHMLRHQLVFLLIQREMERGLIGGNFHTSLASLARRLGHGSISVTEYSYMGTAVAALRVPVGRATFSLPIPEDAVNLLVEHKMRTCFKNPIAAIRELKDAVDGVMEQRLHLARMMRDIQAQVVLVAAETKSAGRKLSKMKTNDEAGIPLKRAKEGSGEKPVIVILAPRITQRIKSDGGKIPHLNGRLKLVVPTQIRPEIWEPALLDLLSFAVVRGVNLKVKTPILRSNFATLVRSLAKSLPCSVFLGQSKAAKCR